MKWNWAKGVCWIAEYPEGCEVTGDCTGATIGWIFGAFPTLSTIFSFIALYNERFDGPAANRSMAEIIKKKIQEVATQALFYVDSFLMPYS